MQHEIAPETNDRRLLAWVLLACAGLLMAMAVPFVRGQIYVADDLGAYHLPLRSFYARQLAAGQQFDWLPSLYNGFYLTGEGQVGTYHPLHWLLYRFLPLTVAFDLELLLSYPLMLLGMYGLLMRRLGQRGAALFGGLVFAFSGFNLLHFVHPNAVAVVAHIPWLLWMTDVLLTTPNVQRRGWAAAAIGLLTGSQLLLGYPQYVWFSLLVQAGYVVSRLPVIVGHRWRVLALLIAAELMGLLVGAVQLLPTIEALGDSNRAAPDAAFANSGSLHPYNAVQLVAPYLFKTRVIGQNTHELGLYFGAVPLLLCAWVLGNCKAWGTYRPLIVAALVLGVFGFVLACGEHVFLYPLQRHLPLVGGFRFPCRAIVLVYLAGAVLASVGLLLIAQSASGSVRDGRRMAPVWCVVGLSILAATTAQRAWPAEYVDFGGGQVTGPCLFLLGALCLVLAARGFRAGLIMLVLMTAVDLAGYGMSYAVWRHAMPLADFIARQNPPPDRIGRIIPALSQLDKDLHVGNELLLLGLRRADGYAGLEPRRKLDYEISTALHIAGVRWVKWRASVREWEELTLVLDKIRLVTKTWETPELASEASAYPDYVECGLVDEPFELPESEPGKVDVLRDDPGLIEVTTDTPARQLLIAAESFHRGWQATVDGRPVPILRVNWDFMGCTVEAGQHRVELRFRPQSLRIGAALSSLGLGLIVGMAGFAWWTGRRTKVKSSQ